MQVLASDAIYDALADKRRRYALHYLKQRSEPVTVRELSEQVAAWENGKSTEELASQERKRVYIALYQSHLSTLDDEGLVDYDDDAGTVALSDAFAGFDLYLEVVPRESVPWSLYYLGLAAANAIVLGLAWGEVAPFDIVPKLGWGLLVLVTFGVSAFVQSYSSRRMQFGDDGPPPELNSR
jgi:DNA-binding transcriptional ArsR family regulator